MCGRYANHLGAMHGWTDILNTWPVDVQLGFNVAPTQRIPVFTSVEGVGMRWGLLPPWLKEAKTSYNTFNARLPTVAEKPAFRHAWNKGQRCLIPAVGYYEWQTTDTHKQPYFVCRSDGQPVVFGGIYESAREQDIPASCSILTRPAEGKMAELHHSMPVMLEPQHADGWLQGKQETAEKIAWRDYADDEMSFYAVSTAVNSVANQGPELIHPLQDTGAPQSGFEF